MQFHQETINCWLPCNQVVAVIEKEWRTESTGVSPQVQKIETKPGVTSGAIRQGINTRFDIYCCRHGPVVIATRYEHRRKHHPRSIRRKTGCQRAITSGCHRPSNRILPIATALPGEGRDTIIVDRFGVFFLQTSVGGGTGGELKAEYINDTAFAGNSYYVPGAGATNSNLTVPFSTSR